jgi:hypothetical protein
MRARRWGAWAATLLPVLAIGSTAAAQYPPPPQPYPPPPQPYPPPPGQPVPYQPVPNQQPYPPQPYPQPYPQPLPAPYPQPGPVPQPVVPPPSKFRSSGEMAYLAGTSIAYGVGTGIWIDSIASISDPAPAFILPVLFGAGVPIGLFVWDGFSQFHRGVPATIATGLLLGGLEGMAISGLQWQLTGGPNGFQNTQNGQWGFSTWTTLTFLTATGGGIGGYFFGEWLWPDTRSLGFISSGAGWGTLAGIMFGAGVGGDAASGAAVWGFAGYNAGILATGALSTIYTPSWETLKYMWLGDLLGTVATTPIYLFYINNGNDARHGLIAQAVGGLAGVGLAAALTYNMQDAPGTASWMPPFQLGVGPTPMGGAQLTAYGQF